MRKGGRPFSGLIAINCGKKEGCGGPRAAQSGLPGSQKRQILNGFIEILGGDYSHRDKSDKGDQV